MTKALQQSEAELKKRLTTAYDEQYSKLEKEIAAYYQTYGVDNVIEYRKLMQALPEKEYKILMRDIELFCVRHPEYAHLAPARRSAYIINRLEGLQMSVELERLELMAEEQSQIKAHLEAIDKRGYEAVIEKTGAVGTVNRDIVKAVVNTDWSKSGNFSSKIWTRTANLAKVLNSEISAGFARGDNYQKLTKTLRQKFSVSQNEAMRLVYTEGTYVLNESTAQAIEQTFDYYAIAPIEDGKTCQVCLDIAASTKTSPVRYSARIAGVNFPPFHPWCRCSTYIVIPDKQAWIENYVRTHGGDPAVSSEQKDKARELVRAFT